MKKPSAKKESVKKAPTRDIAMKEPKFTRKIITIQDYLLHYLPITDTDPITQRPPVHVEADNPKSVAIIECILNGEDIGTITLCNVEMEQPKYTSLHARFVWESLDGGHRKRAIQHFCEGKFRVNGRTFAELSEEEKAKFYAYEMSFTFYGHLTKAEKGEIFRRLNTTTTISDMEILNSYGDLPIANAIRETVRMVSHRDGRVTDIHDLFEMTRSGKFKYVTTANLRLRQEEWVARVYYSFYVGGKLSNRTHPKLTQMYNDSAINVAALKKKVDKFLDFVCNCAIVSRREIGRGLNNSEQNTLLNLYLYMSDTHDLETTNGIEWYKTFAAIYSDLYVDPSYKYTAVPKLKFESKDSTIKQLFCDYTRNHDSAEKQEQLIKWIITHENWDTLCEYTVFKDHTRSFPRQIKEVTLQKQGYVCAIDGLPLSWEDAEAGHIVAHSKGGPTLLDNCAMIRKTHNSDMGTMDVNEYKYHYTLKEEKTA